MVLGRVSCAVDIIVILVSCADQVVPGLEETLCSMKKGEVCVVAIPPEYGFGEKEQQCDLALVPANSTLTYEVEMVGFVKV